MKMTTNTARPVHAFTLIELLIVMAILGLLAAMIVPTIGAAMENATRSEAQTDIGRLMMVWESYKLEKGAYPAPQVTGAYSASLSVEERKTYIGYMTYDFKASSGESGVLNTIVVAYDYPISNARLDENNRYVDQWGDPIHYILGDYANKTEYANPKDAKPKDTNHPMGSDITIADVDWNPANKGAHPYIYSWGGGTDVYDAEMWIYRR